jgi:hypothetical protein
MDLRRENAKSRGEIPLDEIIDLMKTTKSNQQRRNDDDIGKLELQMRKKIRMQQKVSLQDILEAKKIKKRAKKSK